MRPASGLRERCEPVLRRERPLVGLESQPPRELRGRRNVRPEKEKAHLEIALEAGFFRLLRGGDTTTGQHANGAVLGPAGAGIGTGRRTTHNPATAAAMSAGQHGGGTRRLGPTHERAWAP